MVAFPGCKINLGLHILRKRPDGFHDIDTAFYPVSWTDSLEILPADKPLFSVSGLSVQGSMEDNLCLRAYRLLKKDFNIPAIQGHLHKVVPMGAGLGGGSADAAHTLRMINSIFSLNLTQEQLAGYAKQLGSDCAYFLMDGPARGTGRGEILQPVLLDLKGYYLLLIVPAIHVATAEAYARVKPGNPKEDLGRTLTRPVSEWKSFLVNDFEASVFEKYPEIAGLKTQLYNLGAEYAAMSGSGSSVYGLFKSAVPHEGKFPGMQRWSGWL